MSTSDSDTLHTPDRVSLTADIVCAYVRKNAVAAADLPKLLADVRAAIVRLDSPGAAVEPASVAEKATPAQIRKSITPDALISFEDGKPYKALKRHLTMRGLTPNQYRTKHGLPADYPLVSASYSAQRSQIAKNIGLGRPGRAAETAGQANGAMAH